MPTFEQAYKKLALSELQNYTGNFVSIFAFAIWDGILALFSISNWIFVNSVGQLDKICGGYDGG